jgi:hypothetical protein
VSEILLLEAVKAVSVNRSCGYAKRRGEEAGRERRRRLRRG